MKFIGQSHIMNQLAFLLPSLYKHREVGANFLLEGPSGYGKTTMALSIARYLAHRNFEIYWADMTEFRFQKRVVFIDEVHKMANHEKLYPFMDMKYEPNNHVIILATNKDGNLPEALVTRCDPVFIFTEYTDEELILIARETSGFTASDESYMKIIEAGAKNPRIIKNLVDRFSIYFAESPHIDSEKANFTEILENVFDIKDGLDTICRRYLKVLESVGGTASLSLLRNILHVDEGTLRNNIEPILLQKSLVRITAKGRSLHDNH